MFLLVAAHLGSPGQRAVKRLLLLLLLYMCAFVVLDLVASVSCQEIGWEERIQIDLFCVESDVKP